MKDTLKTGLMGILGAAIFVSMPLLCMGCSASENSTGDTPMGFESENTSVVVAEGIPAEMTEPQRTLQENVNDTHISVWTDPETGVQYIVYSRKRGEAGIGGITPRLNADGSLCVVDITEGE